MTKLEAIRTHQAQGEHPVSLVPPGALLHPIAHTPAVLLGARCEESPTFAAVPMRCWYQKDQSRVRQQAAGK